MHHRIMPSLHAIPHQLTPEPGEYPTLEAPKEHHHHDNEDPKDLEGFGEVSFFIVRMALRYVGRVHWEW